MRPRVAELARVATFLASEGKALNATANVLFVDAVSDYPTSDQATALVAKLSSMVEDYTIRAGLRQRKRRDTQEPSWPRNLENTPDVSVQHRLC